MKILGVLLALSVVGMVTSASADVVATKGHCEMAQKKCAGITIDKAHPKCYQWYQACNAANMWAK